MFECLFFFPLVVFFWWCFFLIFIVPLGLKGVGFLHMCNKVVIRMFLINKFYQMDVISLSQFTKCNIFIWRHCFQYVSSICIYSFLLICESIWLHVYNGTAHKENKKKKMETLYFYSGVTLLHALLSDVTLGSEIPHDLVRSFGANYSSFVNFVFKSSTLELTSEPRLFQAQFQRVTGKGKLSVFVARYVLGLLLILPALAGKGPVLDAWMCHCCFCSPPQESSRNVCQ